MVMGIFTPIGSQILQYVEHFHGILSEARKSWIDIILSTLFTQILHPFIKGSDASSDACFPVVTFPFTTPCDRPADAQIVQVLSLNPFFYSTYKSFGI